MYENMVKRPVSHLFFINHQGTSLKECPDKDINITVVTIDVKIRTILFKLTILRV